MGTAGRKYRKMMAKLDSVGLMVTIDRVSKKQFSFLVNGTLVKSYRVRNSCNRQLVKLYNQNIT